MRSVGSAAVPRTAVTARCRALLAPSARPVPRTQAVKKRVREFRAARAACYGARSLRCGGPLLAARACVPVTSSWPSPPASACSRSACSCVPVRARALAIAASGIAGRANPARLPGSVPLRPVAKPHRRRVSLGQRAVRIAARELGVPYRYGGSSPSGFDCSGLVAYVYGRLGVRLPHNAAAQYAYGRPVDREPPEARRPRLLPRARARRPLHRPRPDHPRAPDRRAGLDPEPRLAQRQRRGRPARLARELSQRQSGSSIPSSSSRIPASVARASSSSIALPRLELPTQLEEHLRHARDGRRARARRVRARSPGPRTRRRRRGSAPRAPTRSTRSCRAGDVPSRCVSCMTRSCRFGPPAPSEPDADRRAGSYGSGADPPAAA